jgi:membrane-bound serine protease (ClpP class)
MPVEIIIGGLIIIGFMLILIEIFLVPGFNIFGVFGFIMVVLGIIFAYSKLRLATANFIMVISVVIALILVRVVVKSKTWHRIILDNKEEKIQGFHASTENLAKLIGKRGIAFTPLRPAGIALIEDQKVDVMTEGGFIEKNQEIEVILVEGNRVVVREIT